MIVQAPAIVSSTGNGSSVISRVYGTDSTYSVSVTPKRSLDSAVSSQIDDSSQPDSSSATKRMRTGSDEEDYDDRSS